MNKQISIEELVIAYRLQPAEKRREILYRAHQSALQSGDAVMWQGYEALDRAEQQIAAETARYKARQEESLRAQNKARFEQTGWRPESPVARETNYRGFIAAMVLLSGCIAAVALFNLLTGLPSFVWWCLGGAAVLLFFVSAMRGGPAPAMETATGSATGGQHIHINITGNGGQIHVEER